MSNDFSKGSVWKNIVAQAIPLTLAQLVQLLYNVVDRIYIGHLDNADSMALTGIGITFPVITMIAAFTNLFGNGGTPAFSIARGAGDNKKAEKILGNAFTLLVSSSIILMIISYLFKKPILYLFGASDGSYAYANAYLIIYLIGTPFSMLSTGLNGFINAQVFPRIGMLTTVIGAVVNLILDPVFIFGLNMGVKGAALATVISQFISAVWVLYFLTFGKNTLLRIKMINLSPDISIVKTITSLGLSGFIMQFTNSLVQIVCNSTLQSYGGDLYVGIMTVINSIREILELPSRGITSGSQPVLGYNYGAKKYSRVRGGIRFMTFIGFSYTALAWIFVLSCPSFLISLFSNDASLLDAGVKALNIYFFGFVFMAFQHSGQSTFQGLGMAKQAIFFSIFRKVIIVVPLTILLPLSGFGVLGVFMAEPISNFIGGLASFITMYFTVYRKIAKLEDK
ncbi:MAG: MATE family efflux transporter [Lachnospiraceae bacterium]